MKTKQEQIKEMIKIFTDNREVCQHMRCVECKYHGDEECMYSSYAYSLYQAGYGDVSEYKAEIERLKANWYRSIMDAFENNRDKIVENIQTEIDDYKQSIKQAKIDVLNEVKKRLDSAPNGWAYTTYIDELIEEVQNGEDKG